MIRSDNANQIFRFLFSIFIKNYNEVKNSVCLNDLFPMLREKKHQYAYQYAFFPTERLT